MAHFYQRKHLILEINIFHHGLVKILIESRLKQNNDSWEEFIKRNHFQYYPELNLQAHNSKLEFETLNPVEDNVLSHPQVSVSQIFFEKVTHSQ